MLKRIAITFIYSLIILLGITAIGLGFRYGIVYLIQLDSLLVQRTIVILTLSSLLTIAIITIKDDDDDNMPDYMY